MNIIILFPNEFTDSDMTIAEIKDARRINHIKSTLKKINPGDKLKCGILNSTIGTGIVLDYRDNTLSIQYSPNCNAPQKISFDIAVAFQRPKTTKKIIQFGTSLGIQSFHFFRSWKVDKSYLYSPVVSKEGFHNEALLGLEQSGDTTMPVFFRHELFRPFAEDYVKKLSNSNFLKITAHPQGINISNFTNSISQNENLNKKKIFLILGPEGGFTPFEIELLEKCGCHSISFGSRILRTETVLPFIIGKLQSCFEN